jgi:hypothetical protein
MRLDGKQNEVHWFLTGIHRDLINYMRSMDE